MIIRLDKYLADMQIGTRKEVKELIKKGRITVNNEKSVSSDTKIDTDRDIIMMDSEIITYSEFEYYMLNKPAGVVSASNDPKNKTVINLIKSKRKDLFPVGRLDKDTEGLLLVTNDGELAHFLLAPKSHVDKTYYAVVKGLMGENEINRFKDGLVVDNELTALPAQLEITGYDNVKDESSVEVTIHEGKFHQIKRMFEAVGSSVLYLKRISFGPLKLDNSLSKGQYRLLTDREIQQLKMLRNGEHNEKICQG